MEPLTTQVPVATAVIPAWAEELRGRYLAGEAIQFLLHGNVHDLVPFEGEFITLREFLVRGLLNTKDVILFYDASEGLSFARPEMKERFFKALNVRMAVLGELPVTQIPQEPSELLPILEDFLLTPGVRAALVLDFVESIVPTGDVGFLSRSDRANLITLQRWAKEPALLASDNVVVLVTENIADVNKRITQSPQVVPVGIPMPDEVDRLALIEHRLKAHPIALELTPQQLARTTSGLRRIQLDNLFRQARKSGVPVTFELVSAKRKEIIETECFGLVELVDSRHGLDAVGGMEGVKEVLMLAASAIREGKSRHVPMGIMLVGPMGTGKSFLAEAFAKESGLTCLALKNFREKWVGSTEGNLEKILGIVRALGNVMIIVDEVDRALGGEDGDSGTSSRVFAKIKAFMADTSQRGKVLWLVMTNRPDKLDIDLKRPGRFDQKIPLFFPKTSEERERIFRALLHKNRVEADLPDLSEAVAATEGYSGAELEAIVLLADQVAGLRGATLVTAVDVQAAVEDFIPNRNRRMIEYMELLAVFECSSRRLLPEVFRSLTNEELQERLNELEAELGIG
ncbi:MAG: ATPase central domain protein [Cyanobacteria bacterium RYN_339]|nr:ATPase central domain protein [Cyanobacteria bacterium RYN_339]